MKCKKCGREGLEWSDAGFKGFWFDKQSGLPHKCNREERYKYQQIHKPELGEMVPKVGKMLMGVTLNPFQKIQKAMYIRMNRENIENGRKFDPKLHAYPSDLFILKDLMQGKRGDINPIWMRNPKYLNSKGYYKKSV